MKNSINKIVAISGSFDLLHRGHIRSLEMAKQHGDELVVLLNSDASIKLYKGPTRPIVPQEERKEILQALRAVDRVIVFDEITPVEALLKLKPDVFCNGADYGSNCIERAAVESYGGKIEILDWTTGVSTTDIVEKVLTSAAHQVVKAVFIDRDGTINDNNDGYTYQQEKFTFLPGVLEGLKKLSATDYKIIIITNQSGIARGYYSEHDLKKLHDWFLDHVRSQGIRIDGIYYCPHGPDHGCACRKPGIGMFLQAATELGIALSKSWMIGDTDADVVAGRSANIKTIKIGPPTDPALKLDPNVYAKNFHDAVAIIGA